MTSPQKAFDEIYHLEEEIKSGSFGAIYKAHDVEDRKRKLTIKVTDRWNEEVALNEKKILQDVLKDVPNIVQLIDFRMDHNNIYLVQNLDLSQVKTGDIYDRLSSKGTYSENDARKLMKKIFDTIHHVHRKKVVHRNMKIENILLTNDNDDAAIVICNFDRATVIPDDGEGLRSFCGTPAYMAPEILDGVPYFESVDMWSIGCIMYLLLSGELPFGDEGEDGLNQVYQNVAAAVHYFDTEPWQSISGTAKKLIDDLLMVDPNRRCTASGALNSAWLKNDQTDATPAKKPEKKKKKKRKSVVRKKSSTEKMEALVWKMSKNIYEPFAKNYLIGEEITAGSFGSVHKTHHKSKTDDVLSVKIINRSEEELAVAELSVLSKLKNVVNVTQIVDCKIDAEQIYIVETSVRTLDVRKRINSLGEYTESEAKKLMRRLCETIRIIHNYQVVHRNLKPENLTLATFNEDTKFILSNFDRSKILPANGEGLSTFCGTASYMAPEILDGVPYYDPVDMWSVGCILFFILSADLPFGDDEMDDLGVVFDNIAAAELVMSGGVWESLSYDVKFLIYNLLQKDPNHRFTAEDALQSAWFSTVDGKNEVNHSQTIETSTKVTEVSTVVSQISSEIGSQNDASSVDEDYVLDEVIKIGKFATVYNAFRKARSDDNEMLFAKVFSRENEEVAMMEQQILRTLNNTPNIVPLLDFRMDDENAYLIQIKPKGGDVLCRLEESKYVENDTCQLARNLLEAVQHVHGHKMVHRNLKPENLFLVDNTNNYNIMLGNFDYCRILPEDGTGLVTFCGTPAYTAPEIVEGLLYYEQVDMWSIGCIIYFLLCDDLPFGDVEDYGHQALYESITSASYNFNSAVWKTRSEDAKNFVTNLLKVNPKERWDVSKCLQCDWFRTKDDKSVDTEESKTFISSQHRPSRKDKKKRERKEKERDKDREKKKERKERKKKKEKQKEFKRSRRQSLYHVKVDNQENSDHPKGVTDPKMDKSTGTFVTDSTLGYGEVTTPIKPKTEEYSGKEKEKEKRDGKEEKKSRNRRRRRSSLYHEHSQDVPITEESLGYKEIKSVETILPQEEVSKKENAEKKQRQHRRQRRRSLNHDNSKDVAKRANNDVTGRSYTNEELGYEEAENPPAKKSPREKKERKKKRSKKDKRSRRQSLYHEKTQPHSEELIDSRNIDVIDTSLKQTSTDERMTVTIPDKELPVQLTEERPKGNDRKPSSQIINESFETLYVLQEEIKAGVFSTVYNSYKRCKPEEKLIAKAFERSNEENAKREKSILETLNDSVNVMSLLDYRVGNAFIYMIQKKPSGIDLLTQVEREGHYVENDVHHASKILLQIVEHIHSRKIVHRNLKPENLILPDNGKKKNNNFDNILLCNFDFAKELPNDENRGLITFCGTPAYTAPEIVESLEYREKVDMWSLGCILFFLLGHELPFGDVEDYGYHLLYEYICTGDYSFKPSETWDIVDERAKYLITNLLRVDPIERWNASKCLQCDWFNNSSTKATEQQSKPKKDDTTNLPFNRVASFDESYILGEEIKSGTFATIYSAYDVNKPGEGLMVKIFGRYNEETAMRERNILYELRNVPNVISLLDFRLENENIYLVQNIKSGTNLGNASLANNLLQRLERKQYSYTENDARELGRNLFSIIQYVHDRKIVHRNLKPENFILRGDYDNDVDILLYNFDYAKMLLDDVTGLSTFCGTPAFMAPEIVENFEYREQVDMWSIGCILYLLLSSELPFGDIEEVGHEALYKAVCQADYSMRGENWNDITDNSKFLIQNLLKVNPNKRWTSSECLNYMQKKDSNNYFVQDSSNEEHAGKRSETKSKIQSTGYYNSSGIDKPREAIAEVESFDDNDTSASSRKVEAIDECSLDDHLQQVLLSVENPDDKDCIKYMVKMSHGRKFNEEYVLGGAFRNASFGVTHYARKQSNPEEVLAAKVMNQDNHESALRELAILHLLREVVDVVPIMDFIVEDSRFYLIHSMTKGGNVHDRILERKKYDETSAKKVTKCLLNIIDHVHSHRVVHRNLKPKNLMLKSSNEDTSIVLYNFEKAKILPKDGGRLFTFCGTLEYSAPEILDGLGYKEQVDMWSIGCILFLLLDGDLPFGDQVEYGVDALSERIMEADYNFGKDHWVSVDGDAKLLIINLLKANPKERWNALQALDSSWLNTSKNDYMQRSSNDHSIGGSHNSDSSSEHSPTSDRQGTFNSIPNRSRSSKSLEEKETIARQHSLCADMEFLESYVIGEQLQAGSFRVTFTKANDYVSKESLAAKVINIAKRDSAFNEISILHDLREIPNVTRLIDFKMDDDKIYIIHTMPRGGNVLERLKEKGSYTEYDTCRLAKILFEIVLKLHSIGIVHRDLKPDNLYLTNEKDDASFILCNFDRAKHLPYDGSGLVTFCGTPAYTAPEILECAIYHEHVDMWSIGCILFYLLSGSLPFGDEYEEGYRVVYRRICSGKFSFRKKPWGSRTKQSKFLITTLFQIDPKDRWSASRCLECKWFDQWSGRNPNNTSIPGEQHKQESRWNQDGAKDEAISSRQKKAQVKAPQQNRGLKDRQPSKPVISRISDSEVAAEDMKKSDDSGSNRELNTKQSPEPATVVASDTEDFTTGGIEWKDVMTDEEDVIASTQKKLKAKVKTETENKASNENKVAKFAKRWQGKGKTNKKNSSDSNTKNGNYAKEETTGNKGDANKKIWKPKNPFKKKKVVKSPKVEKDSKSNVAESAPFGPTFYTLEQIQKKSVPGLDYSEPEQYLTDEHILQIFKAPREEVAKWKTWKRNQYRKRANLW